MLSICGLNRRSKSGISASGDILATLTAISSTQPKGKRPDSQELTGAIPELETLKQKKGLHLD
jgi:hypothetical protein